VGLVAFDLLAVEEARSDVPLLEHRDVRHVHQFAVRRRQGDHSLQLVSSPKRNGDPLVLHEYVTPDLLFFETADPTARVDSARGRLKLRPNEASIARFPCDGVWAPACSATRGL